MADEFDLDTDTAEEVEEKKQNKRLKDLSEKVRLTAEERDEKDKLLTQERAEKESLIKERDFLNSFTDVSSKYAGAAEYKDKIKEKVLSGYSVEDATVATLAAEGKFTPNLKPVTQTQVASPVGGSAINQPTTGGDKSISEMTRDEKRAKLVEAEQRGDISAT